MAVTDATLVLGVLAGDREAFAELYDRRAPLVRAICWDVTHDLDQTADLTQEVFLRAFRSLGRLEDPAKFTQWLTGIARLVGREWTRHRRRDRPDGEPLEETSELRTDDSAGDPESRERLARLESAVDGLPEGERRALQAFYLQEKDVEQACAGLGLSRSGLYRRLASARRRIERALQEGEVSR